MSTDRKTRDVPGMILAVLFIALGAWVIDQSGAMSPLGSVFPRTIATALIVLSLALIVMNLRRPRGPRPQTGPHGESWPRRITVVLALAAWTALLPLLGFVTSGVLGFGALAVAAEYGRWTVRRVAAYAATGIGLVTVFYVVLRDVLYIPMPRGILF